MKYYSGKIVKDNNFDFIVNISEDGWFGALLDHTNIFQNLFSELLKKENIFRSSNNGISAIQILTV